MRGRLLALAGYVACIYAANGLTSRYGLIAAGFGPLVLKVTAGTYTAGAALALRVLLQDLGGRRLVLTGLALGAGVSALTARHTWRNRCRCCELPDDAG